MQLLRYMVHIWEDYEGTDRWTASTDLADKIFCGKLLDKYLPHFRYQLVTLTDILKALLYHMNLPENEVEGAVAKIKERKMGLLFENAKLDIQEERRKVEAERQKAEEARQETAAARQQAAAARQEAQQAIAAAQLNQAISVHILRMVRQGASDEEIAKSVMRHFSLDEKQAAEKLAYVFGDSVAKE